LVANNLLSRIVKYEVFLKVKTFVFLEKKVSQTYILLLSQIRWSLLRKQRCRNFFARIFRNFTQIFGKSKLLGVRFPLNSCTIARH